MVNNPSFNIINRNLVILLTDKQALLEVPNEYNPLSLSRQDLLVVSSQQLKLPYFICCLQAQFEFALTAVAEEVNAILQALAK